MRYLFLFVLFALLLSCEEENTCYSCTIVIESNERYECGRRGDRWQELQSEYLDNRFCNEDDLNVFKQENSYQETSFSSCGKSFIIRSRVSC